MDYAQKVQEQIAQYAETIDMHALPDIFHFWSNEYIAPALEEVFGSKRVVDIYVDACRIAFRSDQRLRILSIGCGDGWLELDLANELLKAGILNFEIVGADLSPILLQRFRQKVSEAGLEQHFDVVECDLNNFALAGSFGVIMANHSLHHIVELEKLFDFAIEALAADGVFVTNDMIGRNGHMRWPEAENILQLFWPLMKPKQRYNVQLKRLEETYRNHDCSTEGFEGIRAQDILPLLLDRFHPLKFVGTGGFVDIVVDRGYGHGFDRSDPDDVRFIRCMADLNEMMLDAGLVKPTIMFAQFKKIPCQEKTYRGRTATRSVRQSAAPGTEKSDGFSVKRMIRSRIFRSAP